MINAWAGFQGNVTSHMPLLGSHQDCHCRRRRVRAGGAAGCPPAAPALGCAAASPLHACRIHGAMAILAAWPLAADWEHGGGRGGGGGGAARMEHRHGCVSAPMDALGGSGCLPVDPSSSGASIRPAAEPPQMCIAEACAPCRLSPASRLTAVAPESATMAVLVR